MQQHPIFSSWRIYCKPSWTSHWHFHLASLYFRGSTIGCGGWTVWNYYKVFSHGERRQFRVYDQTTSPFQLILVESEDPNESFENFAASVLYSFDFQICQCGLMPNGKLISVETCTMPEFYETIVIRQEKLKKVESNIWKMKRVVCVSWDTSGDINQYVSGMSEF